MHFYRLGTPVKNSQKNAVLSYHVWESSIMFILNNRIIDINFVCIPTILPNIMVLITLLLPSKQNNARDGNFILK